MFCPRLEKVLSLSGRYNMIPVRYTFLADTETPISLFQKVRKRNSFLLESVEGGNRWARYSFIGVDPFLVFEGKDSRVTIRRRNGETETLDGNPLLILEEFLARYKSPKDPELPRFSGGAVGFFGYELLHYFEDLPHHRRDDLGMNDVQFLFSDKVIAFDHLKQEVQVIAHLYVEEGDTEASLAAKYDALTESILELVQTVRRPDAKASALLSSLAHTLTEQDEEKIRSNTTKEEFEAKVRRAKEYIAAGDIFQVVLSQRFEVETDIDPFLVYRVLRTMNPSPYMYFLEFGAEILVGTSPELLVRVDRETVETRPIAGTRKRGKDEEEDRELEADLLADEKERAEHHMLLDLGRNDIGRVSEFGSVNVDQFMEVEYYSHVMHLVSHVSGKLSRTKTAYDALLSCFPAGTVSGAPKLRAMEIIAELEEEARNAYAGAIGYLSFAGNLDSCITIRTILFKEGKAYVQAGAGVVADSVPENEYEETRNKARALIRSILAAEKAFQYKSTDGEEKRHVETGIE